MGHRRRCPLLVSITVVGLVVASFLTSYAGSVNYIYDDLGRLYQVVDSQGSVTTYNYDEAGNRISITRGTAQEIVSVNPPAGVINVGINALITIVDTDDGDVGSKTFCCILPDRPSPRKQPVD